MHLLDIKREVEGEGKSEDEGESKSERKGEVEKKKPVTVDGQEIEWTKEGLEEILASVGVSCGYNLEVSRRLWVVHPGYWAPGSMCSGL